MVTPALVEYVKKQIINNIPKDIIVSNLVNEGWYVADIEEAFLELDQKTKEKISIKNNDNDLSTKDIYREQINDDNTEKKQSIPLPPTENKIEIPKDWNNLNEKKMFDPKVKINSNFYNTPTIPKINTNLDLVKSNNEELIPNLIPKNNISQQKISLSKKEQDTGIFEKSQAETFFTDEKVSKKLREQAMLSSFQKDFPKDFNSSGPKRNIVFIIFHFIFSKNFIIPIVFLFLIGVGYFVFKKGYINISNINIPYIQDSPNEILLNNPNILSSLLSYKTETIVDIYLYSPEENQPLLDKDKIVIESSNKINQKGLPTSSFEANIVIKNVFPAGDLSTVLRGTGSILFMPISEISQFMKNKSNLNGVLAIKNDEFDTLKDLLTEGYQNQIKNINFQKFILDGLSSYLNDDVIHAYKNYLNSINPESKKGGKIKNVDTYYYDLSNDPILLNGMIDKIAETFGKTLSNQIAMKELANKIKITSFEVWISKKNNNLFKWRIVFDMPLENIKEVVNNYSGKNQARFDWQTTYYDFGIVNKIEMPKNIITIDSFVKSVTNSNIETQTQTP